MFKVLLALVIFQNLSLFCLPGCGNTSLLLFITGDNLYLGEIGLYLSPLNLEMEKWPTVLFCVDSSAFAYKTPFQSCVDFSDYFHYLLLLS